MGSKLGEETYKFTDFLKESNIENGTMIERDHITLREIKIHDMPTLIDKNLRYFERDDINENVIESYLRVLNVADRKLDWRLDAVFSANVNFLKRSDLLYGISDGRFLDKIVQDTSVKDQDDTTSCLKIYKRILLPLTAAIKIDDEFRDKLSKHAITKNLVVTDYGEISINEVKKDILKYPQTQQLNLIIERFNYLLSLIYEELLSDSTKSEKIIQNLMSVARALSLLMISHGKK